MTPAPGAVPAEVLDLLARGRTVLLLAHLYPDGDVLGSQLGLGLALRAGGRSVTFACRHPVGESLRFLPGATEVEEWPAGRPGFDLVVTLDTPDPARVGGLLDGCRGPGTQVLNVDHHGDNRRYGDVNWIQPAAAATGEMVADLLEALAWPVTPEVATNLFTAIATDTGSFRYSNTTPRTLRIAARLVEAGADPAEIGNALYETRHLAGLHLLGTLLQTVETTAGGAVAWLTIDRARAASPDLLEAEDFITYPRSLRTAKVAVLFRELPGETKVSLRAKGEVNVARIAAQFGGGGHPNAAGAIVKAGLEEARTRVLAAVQAALPGP